MKGRTWSEQLLKQALSLSPADETEAVFWGLDEQLTRFANNAIHQNVAEENGYLIVRAVVDGGIGQGATNDLSEDGLARAVEAAAAAAQASPPVAGFPGLPEPASAPQVSAFDEATAGCTPTYRAQAVRAICRQAEEQDCNAFGAFRTGVHELAVANSHGLFNHHAVTESDFTTVVMAEEDGTGFATDASWRISDIDAVGHGEGAIDKALRSRNPQPLGPGVYPVVLEPYAVHDFVRELGRAAGATFVQEGRSWMTGRQGEQLMSPQVSIWDDGLDPAGWPLPFDFEGTPRQRVDIVRQGVAGGAVYDRARAAEEEAASTGHALPTVNPYTAWLVASRYGPIPLHTFMGTGKSTLQEMIAGTERGLYVTRFWYTRTVHPREAVVTGMTRDGTFLIEHGELTRPVRNLRFTQSYLEALAGVEAVGREAHCLWADPGIRSAPALKLAAFNFTG